MCVCVCAHVGVCPFCAQLWLAMAMAAAVAAAAQDTHDRTRGRKTTMPIHIWAEPRTQVRVVYTYMCAMYAICMHLYMCVCV